MVFNPLFSHHLNQYSEILSEDTFQWWLGVERVPGAPSFCRMDASATLNGSLETLWEVEL